MHRIIKSHLENFSKSFGLADLDESEQFEMFVNYAVLTPKVSTTFELGDVTTGEGDDGIDGVAIIVDEELLVSEEDAKSIFKSDRKNHDVEIVFIQAKRSDSFDLGDFLKFKESVKKFIDADGLCCTSRKADEITPAPDAAMPWHPRAPCSGARVA